MASLFEPDEVTVRELRALEPGMSRSSVEGKLGAPEGTGSYDTGRRTLDCVVWDLKGESQREGAQGAFVCFAGDRLALKRRL